MMSRWPSNAGYAAPPMRRDVDPHASYAKEASPAPGGGAPPSAKPQRHEVYFQVAAPTIFGSEVKAVGASKALGAWDPEAGVTLSTCPKTYPLWSARVPAALAGETFEFKYVVLTPDGRVLWEDGPNRFMEPSVDPSSASAAPAPERQEDALCLGQPLGMGPNGYQRGQTRSILDDNKPALDTSSISTVVASDGEEREDCASRTAQPFVDDSCSTVVASDREEEEEEGRADRTQSPFLDDSSNSDREDQEENSGQFQVDSPSVADHQVEELADESGSLPPPSEQDAEGVADQLEGSADEGDSQPPPSEWRLHAGAHRLGKPDGPCEDAYFCSAQGLGVADGVGQMADFAKYGADSAAYAADLMRCAQAALEPGSGAAAIGDPQERAQAAMKAAESEVETFGASTICVLCMEENTVGVANLGDSGFMLLRKNSQGSEMEIVFQSKEQQHGWNCPYQLMRIPEVLKSRVRLSNFDTTEDCEHYHIVVEEGDLLLLYTDGVSDNLYTHEIRQVVNALTSGLEAHTVGTAANAEVISRALAIRAQERSLDAEADVPFNVSARQMNVNFTGGKVDDITVVAAWVGHRSAA